MDHPRSRGVYSMRCPAFTPEAGSSPLARGLRVAPDPLDGPVRIIPARAGFTAWTYGPAAPCHGSSPLARGLLGEVGEDQVRLGIIPARAGFTSPPGPICPTPSDHPRSRGVYSTSEGRSPAGPGSSPLARGLLGGAGGRPRPGGIIPARAGFTPLGLAGRRPPPDHPRSRGVYGDRKWSMRGSRGSSPLARGLPGPVAGHGGDVGIIPARAGFTPLCRGCRREVRDHPRSRGVYHIATLSLPAGNGSSPLARGLQGPLLALGRRLGIIPARAGFTGRPRRPAGRRRDHPRSRGVYFDDRVVASGGDGIIPARAGFTWDGRGMTTGARDHPRSRGVYFAAM